MALKRPGASALTALTGLALGFRPPFQLKRWKSDWGNRKLSSRSKWEVWKTVLIYRLWRVVFRPSLYMRIRRYVAGYRQANGPVGPLDRKVRALEPGEFKGDHRTEARSDPDLLRGRWKLYLTDRRFSGKVSYGL